MHELTGSHSIQLSLSFGRRCERRTATTKICIGLVAPEFPRVALQTHH
jgi:hypothetical protein